jgi:hypothetical protein
MARMSSVVALSLLTYRMSYNWRRFVLSGVVRHPHPSCSGRMPPSVAVPCAMRGRLHTAEVEGSSPPAPTRKSLVKAYFRIRLRGGQRRRARYVRELCGE